MITRERLRAAGHTILYWEGKCGTQLWLGKCIKCETVFETRNYLSKDGSEHITWIIYADGAWERVYSSNIYTCDECIIRGIIK